MIALQLDHWQLCEKIVGIYTGKGPDFGYCPKPTKTILIIKDSSLMQSAQKLLKDKVKITDQGEHHLGSVIGTESFREQYIKNKV